MNEDDVVDFGIKTWTLRRDPEMFGATRIFDHHGREIECVRSIGYHESKTHGDLPVLRLELMVRLREEETGPKAGS